MSDAHILDGHERRSAAALKLEAYLKQRLADHRTLNDDEALTADETAALRGRIAEMKNLLNLLATGEG